MQMLNLVLHNIVHPFGHYYQKKYTNDIEKDTSLEH